MNWYKIFLCTTLFCGSLDLATAHDQVGLKHSRVEGFSATNEVVHYLEPSQVSARDGQLLDRPTVAELFARYRYAWRGTRWQFREIVSPLVHRCAMFLFFASDGLDDYSELTLLVNPDSGQQYLIPIQNHSMVEYPNVENDPHNIAIFNALVAAESMRPEGAMDWLLLTLLPKLKRLDLLPQVDCEGGNCDVKIFDLHPDQSHRIAWDIEFDSRIAPPQLNTVSRELQPLRQPAASP